MNKPFLLLFEGPNCVGKSTLINKFTSYLDENNKTYKVYTIKPYLKLKDDLYKKVMNLLPINYTIEDNINILNMHLDMIQDIANDLKENRYMYYILDRGLLSYLVYQLNATEELLNIDKLIRDKKYDYFKDLFNKTIKIYASMFHDYDTFKDTIIVHVKHYFSQNIYDSREEKVINEVCRVLNDRDNRMYDIEYIKRTIDLYKSSIIQVELVYKTKSLIVTSNEIDKVISSLN